MDRTLSHPAPLPAPRRRGVLAALAALDARFRMQRRLDGLDDHLLRDIGLDAGMARETGRPVWDRPEWWR